MDSGSSQPPTGRGGRLYTGFLTVACAALAVQVVLLSSKNRALEEELAEHQSSHSPRSLLEPGETLTPFALEAPSGGIDLLEFDGEVRRTLLLVLASKCAACPQVMPVWNELVAELPHEATRVVGLQLDRGALGEEGDVPSPWFPIYHLVNPAEVPLSKLTTLPITVVLDSSGTVEWVRYGPLAETAVSELAALLGVEGA